MARGYDGPLINIGKEVTTRELAEIVMQAMAFEGHIAFDVSKPDGLPRKQLDAGWLVALGWQAPVQPLKGFACAYCASVTAQQGAAGLPMKPMTITESTGPAGTHIAELLLSSAYEVRGIGARGRSFAHEIPEVTEESGTSS